jgi:hypothetical protein
MILPSFLSQVGEARAAGRCLGIGKGVRRRQRIECTRPAVGQIGSQGDAPALARWIRIAPRTAPTGKTDLFPSN